MPANGTVTAPFHRHPADVCHPCSEQLQIDHRLRLVREQEPDGDGERLPGLAVGAGGDLVQGRVEDIRHRLGGDLDDDQAPSTAPVCTAVTLK